MAPKSYIDIQVVTLMCHVLNADEDERFEKLMYCVPQRFWMFATHNHNWMDKKKRRPHEISSLKNHTEYLAYLDREKLNSHRFLFTPVLYSEHWWLYVLDKSKQEMFVLDSKNISSPSSERTDLNKFAMIHPTILAGCCTYNIEQWTEVTYARGIQEEDRGEDNIEQGKFLESRGNKEAHNMRLTRPGTALRSPYVQVATPDLPTK
ncbi:hypothetical protein PIB30_054077 [Stylosanthes scabra]|uniref:Ubiquitin-like protease family profile domain-containing protein n=1 Tax=Stylosanthes scabra TaxID=79078 RepID=A0ABU6XIY6_9FABA|nr:hypothetical protein [Stylosanthes scabra]